MDVAKLIRPEIMALAPYTVQEQSGYIKLDAMESPYPWPDELKTAWLDRIATLEINRYPDATHADLKQQVRTFFDVPADMQLLFGNGSDELIQMLLMAVAGSNRTVLSVEPTFTMYRIIGAALGINYQAVALNTHDFSLDVPAMLEAIQHTQPAIVFLSYPNNPTGNNFDKASIREIIRAAEGLVVVDEAYYAFTQDSMLSDLGQFDNLLVMRTLSKVGMAGLRFGILAGPNEWLEQLNKIRLPYNINALTQTSIRFVMDNFAVFQKQVDSICQQREWLTEQLLTQSGVVKVYPSEANFITFKLQQGSAEAVFAGLKEHKVLIKKLHGSSAMLDDCLRVTVGTEEENKAFMQALAVVATINGD